MPLAREPMLFTTGSRRDGEQPVCSCPARADIRHASLHDSPSRLYPISRVAAAGASARCTAPVCGMHGPLRACPAESNCVPSGRGVSGDSCHWHASRCCSPLAVDVMASSQCAAGHVRPPFWPWRLGDLTGHRIARPEGPAEVVPGLRPCVIPSPWVRLRAIKPRRARRLVPLS